jgi:hypothetical protein
MLDVLLDKVMVCEREELCARDSDKLPARSKL